MHVHITFSETSDFLVSSLQLYSRIVGRFLGLRGRIGRRFRNRRHFQSKQWIAHALGSVARVHARPPARQHCKHWCRGRCKNDTASDLASGLLSLFLDLLICINAHSTYCFIVSKYTRNLINNFPIFIKTWQIARFISKILGDAPKFMDGIF